MNVLMTCGTAKSAIIATSTLMPCCSCIVPNVRRPTPSSSSRPIVIIISPSTPATSPRSIDRSARPQIVESPKSTSAKISAGPNLIATAATCSISSIMTMQAEQAAERRGDDRGAERQARLALPRHLVAVEDGRRGRRVAGNAEKNGSHRAARHAAGVDAEQHADRGHGVEAEGERHHQRQRRREGEPGDGGEHQADDGPGGGGCDGLRRQRSQRTHEPRGSGVPRSASKIAQQPTVNPIARAAMSVARPHAHQTPHRERDRDGRRDQEAHPFEQEGVEHQHPDGAGDDRPPRGV